MDKKTKAPGDVIADIKALQQSREVNMRNIDMVLALLEEKEWYDTADWVANHRREYVHGLYVGFEEE